MTDDLIALRETAGAAIMREDWGVSIRSDSLYGLLEIIRVQGEALERAIEVGHEDQEHFESLTKAQACAAEIAKGISRA